LPAILQNGADIKKWLARNAATCWLSDLSRFAKGHFDLRHKLLKPSAKSSWWTRVLYCGCLRTVCVCVWG